jgi:hypothetical protein
VSVNRPTVSTGFLQLDQYLPGGGWPLGTLTEILIENTTVPPLWLIAPALATLSREQHWQAWIAPPSIPYAPALAAAGIDLSKVLLIHPRLRNDTLWAVEQTLRSGACSAVLFWPWQQNSTVLRRLQLAAERGRSWGLCFRSCHSIKHHSMAALRLLFRVNRDGAEISVLKCHGNKPLMGLQLDRKTDLARGDK